jgi:hypothetical protein
MLWLSYYTGFPFDFWLVWLFNHTKVLFQMGEGYAAIHRGGGLPIVGGGGQSDSHSAGSITTQSIALK